MKRLSDFGLLWILGGVLFLIGLVVGMNLPAISVLRLSSEIDPGNVFHGVAILTVGLLIDYRYRKRTEAKRSDTGLLLEDIHQVRGALDKLRDTFAPCEVPQKKLDSKSATALTAAANSLSKKVHSLQQSLNHCHVDLQQLGFDSFLTAADTLSEIVTDDPYPGPYSEKQIKKIIKKFDIFGAELDHMPYKVNHR